MSDQFSYKQRFAIWRHYEGRCYYCDHPIHFRELDIDHVLPERLLHAPAELARTIADFALSSNFRIDDYCNWLPCHSACNSTKGGRVPVVTPKLTEILHRCVRNADAVRNRVAQLEKEPKKEKLIVDLQTGLISGTITREELLAKLDELKKEEEQDQDYNLLQSEIHYHINTDRWREITVRGDIATVSDGRTGGITPLNLQPHHTWQCPHCFSYGPWNGARCLNCGFLSDPSD